MVLIKVRLCNMCIAFQLVALAARDQKRAQALVDKLGFERAYGSYDDLINDAEVSKFPYCCLFVRQWGHSRGFGEQGHLFQGNKGTKVWNERGPKANFGNREHRKSKFWFWGTGEQSDLFQGNKGTGTPWESLVSISVTMSVYMNKFTRDLSVLLLMFGVTLVSFQIDSFRWITCTTHRSDHF